MERANLPTVSLAHQAVLMQWKTGRGSQRTDERRGAKPQPKERGCVRRGPAAAAPNPRRHPLASAASPAANPLRLVLRAPNRAPRRSYSGTNGQIGPLPTRHFPFLCPKFPCQTRPCSRGLRPAPPTKSRLSLRASHGYAGSRSVAIPSAPFPLHALRPRTGRAPLGCGSAALRSSCLCGSPNSAQLNS